MQRLLLCQDGVKVDIQDGMSKEEESTQNESEVDTRIDEIKQLGLESIIYVDLMKLGLEEKADAFRKKISRVYSVDESMEIVYEYSDIIAREYIKMAE